MDPRLQLEPAAGRAYLLLFVFTVLVPVIVAVVLQRAGNHLPQPEAALLADSLLLARLLGAGMVLAIAVLLFAGTVLLMRRHRLSIDAGGIEVATTFYTRRFTWAELRLDAARVVSRGERPEISPVLKTNGVAMPGFRSGWFRSRSFGRLFVAIAGGDRLLWLPTTKGYDLLLEPVHAGTLLEQLREQAAAMAPARAAR